MGNMKRFGEEYWQRRKGEIPAEICEVCRGELEMDPESAEGHCPVCENPEQ